MSVGRARVRALLACAVLLPLVGCSAPPPVPEAVPLGRVRCARCGQLVNRLETAAQAVHPGGVLFYDDIGCLALDDAAFRPGAQLYVQLAGGKGWARAQDVRYASPDGVETPRGYNFLAFPEDEGGAADRNGWARGWDDLVRELHGREKATQPNNPSR